MHVPARPRRFRSNSLPVLLAAVVACGLVPLVGGCSGLPQVPNGRTNGTVGSDYGQPDTTVLAIVGDTPITAGELRKRILGRFYGRRALEGLIKERLFRDEAERLGLTVTEDEVSARVDEEINALLRQVGGKREDLAKAFEEQGTTLAERRRDLYHEYRNLLLIERVVHAQRRRWGVTDKALRARYAETYAQTSVRVRHIAFPVKEQPATAAAAAEALAELEKTAQQVQSQLASGADFAQLAQRYSGDPATGPDGGLLGWMTRDALPDSAMAETIFRLPVGVASDPVRQDRYGYHIFLVEERREAQPFEAVRDRLEQEILQSPPSAREIQSISKTLRGQAVTVLTEPVFEEASTPRKEQR
ncbi:MAG: peptidylprolyl isomerase [Planctomycetota bacterium]